MNTRFEYLYRDAGNYKQWGEVVLDGELALSHIEPYLYEGMYFIPQAVGLPGLAEKFAEQGYAFPCSDDHPWHEIVLLSLCSERPTTQLAAAELLARFEYCFAVGWDTASGTSHAS